MPESRSRSRVVGLLLLLARYFLADWHRCAPFPVRNAQRFSRVLALRTGIGLECATIILKSTVAQASGDMKVALFCTKNGATLQKYQDLMGILQSPCCLIQICLRRSGCEAELFRLRYRRWEAPPWGGARRGEEQIIDEYIWQATRDLHLTTQDKEKTQADINNGPGQVLKHFM